MVEIIGGEDAADMGASDVFVDIPVPKEEDDTPLVLVLLDPDASVGRQFSDRSISLILGCFINVSKIEAIPPGPRLHFRRWSKDNMISRRKPSHSCESWEEVKE